MNRDPRFDRAMAYVRVGQLNEAVQMLAELLGDDPNEPVYHAVLASCLLSQKRLVGAEYELDIAQSLDPNLPLVYLVRARQLHLQRKFRDALQSCDEALRLHPEYVDAMLVKAELLRLVEMRDEAYEQLEQAAAIEPDRLDVLIAFGDHYNAYGQHNEAYQLARDALRVDAGSDDANVLMGETLLALGDTSEADAHARYAVSQNPHNTAALQLLVNVRMRQNWFIGLWWRFNSWATRLTSAGQAFVLIVAYVVFQLASQIAWDLDYKTTSKVLDVGWLVLVLYSWIGIPIYLRALKKSLEEFQINPRVLVGCTRPLPPAHVATTTLA